MIEITTPVGRLVKGHPMNRRDHKKNDEQQFNADGSKKTGVYLGIAIPKEPGKQWWETEWGCKIYQEGRASFPNGEYQRPTFAWKINDGDNLAPNDNGTILSQLEGHAGNWILNCYTLLNVPSFHAGKYQPIEQIQNPAEIKTGDYCRVLLEVKNNIDPKTGIARKPGVYINPRLFELSRPGVEIMAQGPDASATFGGQAPQLPAGAQLAPVNQAPAMPPVNQAPAMPPVNQAPAMPPVNQAPAMPPVNQAPAMPLAPPAHDFVNVEPKYNVGGQIWAESDLVKAGYTAEHMATLPRV